MDTEEVPTLNPNFKELTFASYTVVYKDEDYTLLESLEKLLNGNIIPAENAKETS